MTTREYKDWLDRISRLSQQDKVKLLAMLTSQMRTGCGPRHSIMELEGLGKEIWEGIDAQEYVDRERDSWGDERG